MALEMYCIENRFNNILQNAIKIYLFCVRLGNYGEIVSNKFSKYLLRL